MPKIFSESNFTLSVFTRSARSGTSKMASVDKELEEELVEAGEKLLDPPSSVDDLITVLIVSTLLFFFLFLFVSLNSWDFYEFISLCISHFCVFCFVFFVHGAYSLGFCESILHVVSGFVFALIEFILCIIGEYLRFWNLFHRLVAIC